MRDSLDTHLIAALRADGRATYRRLAAVVQAPLSTVRSRMIALFAEGVVRVSVLVHPAVLDRAVEMFLYVRVDEQAWQDPGLTAPPGVTWLARVIGMPELIATVRVSSLAEGSVWVERFSAEPWVISVETIVSLSGFVGVHGVEESVSGAPDWAPLDPRLLDDTDFFLIRDLQRDGRSSYTMLSRAARLSLPATRRRVLRLFELGAIRVWTSVADDDAGVHRASVRLVVRAGREATLTDSLVNRPGVSTVNRVTGRFALEISLTVHGREEFSSLIGWIVTLDGVLDHQVRMYELVRLTTVPAAGEDRFA